MQRRHMLATGAAMALLARGLSARAAEKVLRIGVQKYGTLILLKTKGLLEEKLAPLGYQVEWTEFPAGPQLLEALNVGSIDFGTVGEAPPIFAQAAGAPIVYVGYEPPAPEAEAILVPKDSPLKGVGDLKGKKVALNKGSNVHYLLVKALENAGLKYTDVTPVFLKPSDARAAFEHGDVDAWVIWDPFQASAEIAIEARTLRRGRPRLQPPVLSGRAQLRRSQRRRRRRHHRFDPRDRCLGRQQCRHGGNRAQPRGGHSRAGPEAGAEPAELGRQAAHARGRRRAAKDRRHLLGPRPDPQADHGARRGARQRVLTGHGTA